ncbi:MAG TPA: cellulase family glycosylhydrolase, partial [Promineifilum sp.]|nr:cellulase family glycosylhydrolase [Promineifilum sp.]
LPPPVISGEILPTPTLAPVEGETAEEIAPTAPEISGPFPADQFGYGIQIHGNATVGNPADTMTAVHDQLGMNWVKAQIQWWLVRPDPDPAVEQWFFYDAVIDEAHNKGLRLMVSVVGAPEWTRAAGGENGPPDDYNEYARFLGELIDRHPGKIDAIEVWNEQNLDREWTSANGISPEDYVRFLQTAYEAIKAKDPNIIVISGALSPTGTGDWVKWADDFEYLDRALAAGMLNYADCVGAHHNGYNIGPDVAYDQAGASPKAATATFRGPFDNPHHSWSFYTTLNTYADKVQAVDPNKKLCVTEFGWAISEGYAEYPVGFEFALDNTLQDQATYITQAFNQMNESNDVWLAFLFNFDFGNKGGGPTDDPTPYSIIDTQGMPRPAFDALAAMPKDP